MGFFRVIRFAFQDMGRNLSLSLMTILILILMLLSVNTLLIIRVLTQEATASVKNQIDVSIFFHHEVTEDQVTEVADFIESFPEVIDIAYYDSDEVLSQFQEQHADSADILAALEELDGNPLGPTFVIKTREPGDYKKIITALSVPEYEEIIEAKTFEDTEKAIARIDVITSQVERFTFVLSIFFAFIAFLIIFNTIRVAIYTQRTEISIKKLVGATNWFIRGPYIVEAFVFSLISTAIVFTIVFYGVRAIDPFVAAVFSKSLILTSFFESNILLVLAGEFGVVLLLTIFTSWLAMRRHLRV